VSKTTVKSCGGLPTPITPTNSLLKKSDNSTFGREVDNKRVCPEIDRLLTALLLLVFLFVKTISCNDDTLVVCRRAIDSNDRKKSCIVTMRTMISVMHPLLFPAQFICNFECLPALTETEICTVRASKLWMEPASVISAAVASTHSNFSWS
jgi:hypothetical protein